MIQNPIFQARHLWQHDHYCDHAEDVAITCEIIDDQQSQFRQESLSSSPDDEVEVLPIATVNALNLQGNNQETCGIVRVDVPQDQAVPR